MQLSFVSFFTLLIAASVNAQLTINTPTNVVECLPQLISWSGGTGPYFVSVLPGGQPSASALVDFGQQNGTSLTWVVNIAAGTSVGLTLRDSTGTTAQSAPFTIQSGSDSSCVGSSAATVSGSSTVAVSSSESSASGATTTTAASGSTTSSASTTAPATSSTHLSGSSTSHASSSVTPSSNASSTSSNSAAKRFAEIGSAGLIGAAVVAIFA